MYEYDLFVIGAGSGGVRAARMSASYGARVACAEDRYMGGTCVNVGCVPKKLFVYASHYSEEYEQSKGFGWDNVLPQFNWPILRNNKDKEIKRLNSVYLDLLDAAGVTYFRGRARIVDEHHIVVGDSIVSTEKILIATGSWPDIPAFPGREYVISSNEAFSLDNLPKRALVVGGGYIAIEFAGIFSGLGVETYLSYRGSLLLKNFDQDIRTFTCDELKKKYIDILFNTLISRVEKLSDGTLEVIFSDGRSQNTDLVLFATGRKPNVQDLGLESLGVKCRDNGAIIVDEQFRSSVPNIFALGDVTDRVQLTPVAIAEAMAFARTQFNSELTVLDYDGIPTAVFCQPNIGTVGLTEDEAKLKFNRIQVFKSEFKGLKHSLSGSEERTMMKLIVDVATDQVVGIHMVGPEAGEIIQGLAVAYKAGATKSEYDATIGIHPTSAEEFVTMREPVQKLEEN
ncbi:MAG: glutathione-disulfide reductase [Candidatus Azotimanducaceae bacterium]|uniref:Glutathione-disulfide reductase n=1 Tax=OM182 bacterium TaxID=2510334 RepID=A0A520S0F4_9GAMM|nr:glutathione-disulfide reductase [Gammaproteobacteria bacterium]OUV67849.1 MAG: glutathione-disulfide reductase [Gammaproteobacteria bacterium TMED133]RZO75951.1 MAG: glutathione-disulfide reductase [OM182 bacterium]